MPSVPDGLRVALVHSAAQYPGMVEDFPWGERVAKVNKKVFAFLGRDDGPRVAVAFKLPESCGHALSFAASEPTGHGLGRAGWVTIHLDRPERPGGELLLAWLDESYRAVAPAKLVAQLDANRMSKEEPRS